MCFYFEGQAEVAFVTRIRQLVQPVKRGSGGAPLLVFALRLKHLAAGRSETNNLPFKRRGRVCGGARDHGKCSSVASERSTRMTPGPAQRIVTRHEVRRFDGLFGRDVSTNKIKNTESTKLFIHQSTSCKTTFLSVWRRLVKLSTYVALLVFFPSCVEQFGLKGQKCFPL